MKKMFTVLTCLLSGLSLAGASWDFENGNKDWSPWGVNANSGLSAEEKNGIVTVTDIKPYSGTKALKVTDSFTSLNPYLALGKSIPYDPVKRYCFSGYIRSDEPVESRIGINTEIDNKGNGSLGGTKIQVTTDWQEFKIVSGEPKNNATDIRPVVFIFNDSYSGPEKKGSIYLDNLSVTEISFENPAIEAPVKRSLKDDISGDGKGGWTDQGESDLRNLKDGIQQFCGIPFDIKAASEGVISLSRRPGFGESAIVKYSGKADWIYVLNTCAWAQPESPVGSMKINYSDKSSSSLSFIAGANSGDWWNGNASKAGIASLSLACPAKSPVYLFVSPFRNPEPSKEIVSIEFKTASDKVMWFIFALSLVKGDVDVMDRPVLKTRNYADWYYFEMKNRKSPDALVDLSFLLDAPAGKHGFLKSKGGKFVFEDGSPARFFGTNIHGHGTLFPTKAQAEELADTLARSGINLVRLHLMEYTIIDNSRPDRQHLISDPELWDKFDYYIKCLKDKGIYVVMDSVTGLSARDFQPADNVIGGDFYFHHRPWAYYDPYLKELGKKYMKDLLTHVNKYTGKAIIDEPAVAMMMIINEQSAFFDWGASRKNKDRYTPDHYKKLLASLFSKWLKNKYGSTELLAKAWGNALSENESLENGDIIAEDPMQKSPAKHRDYIVFHKDLQTDYYREMKAELEKLGLKVPLAGTNIIYDIAELDTHTVMDYTSQNEYFDHAKFSNEKMTVMMQNQPLVKVNPLSGKDMIEPGIAAVKLSSMPVTSTESDAMWPHEWRCAYLPSLASSSALQDWDAIMQFAYMGWYTWDDSEKTTKIMSPTTEFNDPAIFGTFPAAALIYHRRDIAASKNKVEILYNEDERMEFSEGTGLRTARFPFNYLPYVSRVETTLSTKPGKSSSFVLAASKPEAANSMEYSLKNTVSDKINLARSLDKQMKDAGLIAGDRGLQDGRIVSDTGEITRDWKNGQLIINSARTQGISGFPGKGENKLNDAVIKSSNLFVTVVLSSLDGKDLKESGKVLLTTVGRAENDKDRVSYIDTIKEPCGTWNEKMTVERSREGRILTEKIDSEIKLNAKSVKMTALKGDMSAAAPAIVFNAVEGMVTVKTGSIPSVWYLLEIER